MNEHLKQALIEFKKLSLPNVKWIGFREVQEKQTFMLVRDGHSETTQHTLSHGVMAEVLVNGQLGYAATPHLDPENLAQAGLHAYSQALHASPFGIYRFSESVRPPTRLSYASPCQKPFTDLKSSEIIELLIEISKRLKCSSKIVKTSAYVEFTEKAITLVSSSGAEAQQNFLFITSDFEAVAIIQKRTDAGMRGRSYQGGLELFLSPQLWQRVDTIAEQALELLHSKECPTLTCDLVLKPDQMMLQIHESIGHPLELDRILGDERNYAGWSFVKPEDFGRLQYGSSLLNITFDPTLPHELASYALDDVGAPAQREFLIQNGLLLRGLGGLESQIRSKIPGVSNSRSTSWNRPPIDRMANLNLEPGDTSFLDIIASVEEGILMESNRSWSIDDFRNKFQFGCEYAKRIKNGKITETLKNPNYRGSSIPFWNSLKKVGDTSTFEIFGTPYCGKGEPNQSIRVGHASPVCLFDQVEIFGGAK
jgi:predicted Zn-dependent protease